MAREDAIGRAAGYEGAQVEMVEVNGGFRLKVASVKAVASTDLRKNAVRARLRASGVEVDDPAEEDVSYDDWYGLLDDPSDVDVLDQHLHMVGKITGYDRDVDTLHVQTDKVRRLPRVGLFFVKNHQKERLLRQQEVALDLLERGETVRPDMPHLGVNRVRPSAERRDLPGSKLEGSRPRCAPLPASTLRFPSALVTDGPKSATLDPRTTRPPRDFHQITNDDLADAGRRLFRAVFGNGEE